jgi:hypothetical protein
MANSFYNKPQKIEINCPYCWAEFTDYQQINGRIRYQKKMYDDLLILPVENAKAFPYYIKGKSFAESQEIKPIKCDSCHREYTLILAPWERGNYDTKNTIFSDLDKKYETVERPSLLEKLVPCDLDEKSFKKGILNFRYFLLFNFFPLLAMSFLAASGTYVTSLSILMLILSEVILIFCVAWLTQKINLFFEIENLPLLLNENYLLCKSFKIFKQHFFNFKRKKSENSLFVLKFTFGLTILLLGISLWMSWENYSDQPLLAALFIILIVGLFFWFLILILSSISALLLNSFEYSTLISTKIPLRLDPWEKEQKINIFKKFWGWTLAIFLFSLVGLEIILNISPINDAVKTAISTNNFGSVITPLLHNPFGLIFTFLITIIIFLFIVFFHSFDNNIKRRKNELLFNNNERLQEIRINKSASNNDVIDSIVLVNEIKMIDEIPLFFLKWSIFVVVI